METKHSPAHDREVAILRDEIMSCMRHLGGAGVSFVELSNRIDGFRHPSDNPSEGYAIYGSPTVIFWYGMTQAAVDAMISLAEERFISTCGTSPMVYMFDGKMPELPIAKRPNYAYKNLRWFPVSLRLTTAGMQTRIGDRAMRFERPSDSFFDEWFAEIGVATHTDETPPR